MKILNRHLKKSPLLGERLILEINADSAMKMPELVTDFMDGLQERNISFAMDNFGNGQMVLHQFRNFFFDAVKIDGQFIRGIHANPDNQALVKAMVGIARTFDMLTIAESVEKREEAEFLAKLGIDCLQGYFFAAPTIKPPWIKASNRRATG